MKVTALIDNELIENIKEITKGQTITESLVIALKEWVSIKRLRELSADLKKRPIKFKGKDVTNQIRELSRRKS